MAVLHNWYVGDNEEWDERDDPEERCPECGMTDDRHEVDCHYRIADPAHWNLQTEHDDEGAF